MSDINDLLKGLNEEPLIEEVAQEPETQAEEEVQEAAVEETPTQVEAEPVTEVPPVKEANTVPITALLDEREKRQQLQAKVEQLEREKQAQQTPAHDAPTLESDPIAYHNQRLQAQEEALFQIKLENSFERAKIKYGDTEATEAGRWALEKGQSDPYFGQRLENTSGDTFDKIIAEYRKDKLFNDYSADPKTFAERLMKEHGLLQTEIQPEVVLQAPPVLPTGTIADMPSAGKTKISDSESGFDALNREIKTKGR